MSRTISSLCIAGVASLALLTPTMAHAAPEGAQGAANALTATVLGESSDTGTTRATNDGTGEDKTGPVNPLPTVLPGQPYAGIGVLAQDAAAADNAISAACAGVAGDGGSANVVEVGDTDCIVPGENLDVSLANLDLSVVLHTEVIEGTGTLGTLLSILGPGDLATVLAALNSAVDEVEARLGNAGLLLNAGAIESSCTYDGQAAGTTYLTDVGVDVVVPEVGRETLVTLDPQPAPNTEVVTELDAVVGLVVDDLRAGLNTNLDALDPVLAALIDPIQTQVVDEAVAQLQPALAELEADILQLTLNRQTHDGRSIAVTGLAAALLPGAEQFGAPTVVDLDIANVGCGPFRGAATTGRPGTTDGAGNPVPTVVNAGEESASWTQSGMLGLLALLVGGGAVVGLRRARS